MASQFAEVHGIARSTCAVFGLPALQGTLGHSSHRASEARTEMNGLGDSDHFGSLEVEVKPGSTHVRVES